MAIVMPSRQEMGERVWKVWQLSGLTQTAFAKLMVEVDPELNTVDRNLLANLRQGNSRVAGRLRAVARVVAGRGLLEGKTAEEILRYLNFDDPSFDLIVKSPSNGGRQTPDRVKEADQFTGKVTTGVRGS